MARFYGRTDCLLVLAIIVAVGFGCKYLQPKERTETPEVSAESKKTVITKAVLSQRLTVRLVQTADKIKQEKPNPLTLQLGFSNNNKDFLLNREYFENFDSLATSLRNIFKERESNGVFVEGTNDIYEKITLPMYQSKIDEYNSKRISVEDFEKLVDDLRLQGFQQIELDTNEENQIPEIKDVRELSRIKSRLDSKSTASDQSTIKEVPKTISGGVLNGKAIDLAKPAYPAAARAVRASGAVNVQVTVDENGDVVSAAAVSGHPLLRGSAETAARSAKFKPTLLSGKPVKVTGVIVYNFQPE